jgi:hypothetical protein
LGETDFKNLNYPLQLPPNIEKCYDMLKEVKKQIFFYLLVKTIG